MRGPSKVISRGSRDCVSHPDRSTGEMEKLGSRPSGHCSLPRTDSWFLLSLITREGGGGGGCVSDSGTWGPPDSSLCLWHLWHLLRYKYNPGGIYPTPSQPLAQRPGETGGERGVPLNRLSFPLRRVSVLVGAPKANTSQPGVLQGGAVYLCPWGAGPVHCSPIEFDSKGNSLG